jgi:hypothetical protein
MQIPLSPTPQTQNTTTNYLFIIGDIGFFFMFLRYFRELLELITWTVHSVYSTVNMKKS